MIMIYIYIYVNNTGTIQKQFKKKDECKHETEHYEQFEFKGNDNHKQFNIVPSDWEESFELKNKKTVKLSTNLNIQEIKQILKKIDNTSIEELKNIFNTYYNGLTQIDLNFEDEQDLDIRLIVSIIKWHLGPSI